MGCADWRCLDSPCFLTPSASSRPPPRPYRCFNTNRSTNTTFCCSPTAVRQLAAAAQHVSGEVEPALIPRGVCTEGVYHGIQHSKADLLCSFCGPALRPSDPHRWPSCGGPSDPAYKLASLQVYQPLSTDPPIEPSARSTRSKRPGSSGRRMQP